MDDTKIYLCSSLNLLVTEHILLSAKKKKGEKIKKKSRNKQPLSLPNPPPQQNNLVFLKIFSFHFLPYVVFLHQFVWAVFVSNIYVPIDISLSQMTALYIIIEY